LRKPAATFFVALMAILSMAPAAQAEVVTTGKLPASDPDISVTLVDERRPLMGESERSRSGGPQKVGIESQLDTFFGPPSPNCLGRRQVGVRFGSSADYIVPFGACYRDGIVADAGLDGPHFLSNVPTFGGRPLYELNGYADGTPSITGVGTSEVIIEVHGVVMDCGGGRCLPRYYPKVQVKIHHTGQVDWSAVG
jgi:hypothetical protein